MSSAVIQKLREDWLLLSAPLLVYGWAAENSPFHDVAPILSLNVHGGVLALAVRVQRGQTILLVNSETQEHRKCRVIYVGPEGRYKTKVAFEFVPW